MNPQSEHFIRILPYKAASRGAKTLKTGILSGTVNYPEAFSRGLEVYRRPLEDGAGINTGSENSTFVNWGIGREIHIPSINLFVNSNNRILNKNIGRYSDKRKFFQALAGFSFIPRFFTESNAALQWLLAQPSRRLCVREKVQASGGEGLSILSYTDTMEGTYFPEAPLYVEYKPKKHEFRYHFFAGSDGILQQKRLRHGTTIKNFEIRNHHNNWVFCRENVEQLPAVVNLCHRLKEIAVGTWGLHFGAFDIIYNQTEDRAYVLEINTAPGLEGQTAKDYAKFFLEDHFRNTCGFSW